MNPEDEDGRSSVSNKEKCRRYREKKKLSKGYLENERERKRSNRANRTPEQIARDRETAKQRMRKYRLKKIQEEPEAKCVPVIETRKQKETKRAKWKLQKQIWRSKQSAQKLRRIRERDANKKKEKARLLREKDQNKKSKNEIPETTFTPTAERKAFSRVRKMLPKHPTKFATIIGRLVGKASPRKRQQLSVQNIVLTPTKKKKHEMATDALLSVRKLVSFKKGESDKQRSERRKILRTMAKKLKKCKQLHLASKEFGIRWQTMVKWSKNTEEDEFCNRLKRSDAMDENSVNLVQEFYRKPYISVVHSAKDTVEKNNTQRQTLNFTLKESHEENPNLKVSYSKFASLKPKNVKTVDKQTFRSCLCERCVNVELLIQSLNPLLPLDDKFKHRYHLSDVTVCPYDNFPRLECVQRNCTQCGLIKGLKKVTDILEQKPDDQVKWSKWQSVKVSNKKSSEVTSRKVLVEHSTDKAQLKEE